MFAVFLIIYNSIFHYRDKQDICQFHRKSCTFLYHCMPCTWLQTLRPCSILFRCNIRTIHCRGKRFFVRCRLSASICPNLGSVYICL